MAGDISNHNNVTGDISTNSSDDARISSFYSPSPAVRSRGVTRVRNVHIGPEDFETVPVNCTKTSEVILPKVTHTDSFESPVSSEAVQSQSHEVVTPARNVQEIGHIKTQMVIR